MKFRFNSDDDLRQNKTKEIHNAAIDARAFFHESTKYCPNFFFYECLYKL